jgi:sulfate adenylyltransferase
MLVEPYGGKLVNLLVADEELEAAYRQAAKLPRLQLTARNLCDLELLASGSFSPVDSFLCRSDYVRVLEEMRLSNGTLFPIPITLSVGKNSGIKIDSEIALTDQYNTPLAIMNVEDIYEWDRKREAHFVCQTTDPGHPLCAEMNSWGDLYIHGRLRVLTLPSHYDFKRLRMAPAEVRSRLNSIGMGNVVAFQTRNPIHRAHEELTKRAAAAVDGALLLHPVVGLTKPGDVDHFTRVRSYLVMADRYYDRSRTVLALLPLAMRMAGPREALLHAIIRRNYGANHLIVGRDHASPGNDSKGRPFYGPYDAQNLMEMYSEEIGIRPLRFSELLYIPGEDRYEERHLIPPSASAYSISGTEVRNKYLLRGETLPHWFTRPEVASILSQAYPPRHQQGFCIWLTGLSGAGKSTTADILTAKLLEHGRQVTLLDGDLVRAHLSKELGFSREDRDTNLRRVAFVASEVARQGGGVICALVSPFRGVRDECRLAIGYERFIEVFVNTPLEVCERRDKKGLYERARNGLIKNLAGVDDPYEPPINPEIVIDTIARSAEENAELILAYLIQHGFVLSSFSSGDTA